jgi:polyhydroxybutyrate depolymerase
VLLIEDQMRKTSIFANDTTWRYFTASNIEYLMTNFITSTGTFFITCFIFLTLGSSAQTTIDDSFIYGGIERTYRIYIPALYDPQEEVPMLFNLHGYGSNNLEQEFYGDFRGVADTANFIIVHPNGTFDKNNNRFWNTFGNSNVDDVGFLSALIDTISSAINIDQEKIYSTGMSNGGFMSYHLACFLSDRVTAVASVTGSMTNATFNTCDPNHPVPSMHVHGTLDATVPYNGNFFFVAIESLVDFWVQHNNCEPEPTVIQIPDIDTTDGCTAEQYIYSGGDQETSVEFFKVIGGGHSWPGAPLNINITNMDFNASVEIWRFLSHFNKDQLTTGSISETPVVALSNIYPNPSKGHFTLQFPGDDLKSILITNSLGHKIQGYTCRCSKKEIYLNQKGIYMLTIVQGDNVISKKLIVN